MLRPLSHLLFCVCVPSVPVMVCGCVYCFCGAMYLLYQYSCPSFQKCYHFVFQRYRLEHYTVTSNWLALGTVFLFGLLSFSRSVALFRGKCAGKAFTHTHRELRCLVHLWRVVGLCWEKTAPKGKSCDLIVSGM